MLPDRATIYIAGGGPGAVAHTFWRQVYGFDMEPIGRTVHEAALASAAVATVSSADVVTEAVAIQTLDIMSMTAQDADFTAEFELVPRHQVRRSMAGAFAVVHPACCSQQLRPTSTPRFLY